MSVWKISPEGVDGVLKSVQTAQGEVGKDLSSTDLDPVGKAVTMPTEANPGGGRQNGVTGEVMAALGAVFESEKSNIQKIQSHIVAGIYGVANAAYEYQVAQVSMSDYSRAEAMQAAMFVAAGDPDKLSYFDENGHFRPEDAKAKG